jgi:hypothetical protein
MTWFDMYNEFVKNFEKINDLYNEFIRNYEKMNRAYEQQFDNV